MCSEAVLAARDSLCLSTATLALSKAEDGPSSGASSRPNESNAVSSLCACVCGESERNELKIYQLAAVAGLCESSKEVHTSVCKPANPAPTPAPRRTEAVAAAR